MGKLSIVRYFIVSLTIFTSMLVFVSLSYSFSNGNEEPVQVISIPFLASSKEAFEKGYADGLVTIKPEVSTVTPRYGEVTVKLSITYQRRMPAPEVIELRFLLNQSACLIPYNEKKYVNVNDYMRYKPEVVKIREGETAEAWVTIEFTEELIRAVDYNKSLGSDWMPFFIYVDITENHVPGKEYKGIDVEFVPPIKVVL